VKKTWRASRVTPLRSYELTCDTEINIRRRRGGDDATGAQLSAQLGEKKKKKKSTKSFKSGRN